MKSLIALAATLLASAVLAVEVDLKTAKVTGSGAPAEIIEEANGTSAIFCKGIPPKSGSATVKNRYLSFIVKLPQPMDLTGRSLSFRVRSSKPELLTGFFVRGYNQGASGKFALAWTLYMRKTITSQYQTLQVFPGRNNGEFTWLSKQVTGDEPTSIDRIQFLFCTGTPDEEIDLSIQDIWISDEPVQDVLKTFWAPAGEFAAIEKSVFQKNPVLYCEKDGESYTLTLRGHSVAKPTKLSQYEGAVFRFAKPVSLQDRDLKLNVKIDPNVVMLFVRAYNKGSKKADASYAIQCKTMPRNEWTQITLSKNDLVRMDVKNMTGNPLTEVDRMEVIMATYKADQDFQVQFKELQ